MKKSILNSIQITALLLLFACNPEESKVVTEDDSDSGQDTDIPINPPEEEPEETNAEFIADIFFIHANKLFGIRDDFFEVDHQGIGTMDNPFLSINLPPTTNINVSTPLIFKTDTEQAADSSNLKLATVSGDGTVTVYRVDETDRQNWVGIWSNQLSGGVNTSPATYGSGSSRILIFADLNGTVHALNACTGTVSWTFTNAQNSPFIAHPIVIPELDLIVVASFNGFVYGLNAQNGNELWRYNAREVIFAKPYFHKNSSDGIDSVVVVTQLGDVFRINATTGSLLWNVNLGPDRFSSTSSQAIFSAPSSDGTGNGFFIASANRSLFNLNIETGAITWENNVALEGFRSSINALNETLAFGIGSFGTFYQLSRSDANNPEWQWSTLQLPNSTEGGIVSSPVIAESGSSGYGSNRIYVKTANTLYGIDQDTNQVASEYVFSNAFGTSEGSPMVVGTETSTNETKLFYPPNTDNAQ